MLDVQLIPDLVCGRTNRDDRAEPTCEDCQTIIAALAATPAAGEVGGAHGVDG